MSVLTIDNWSKGLWTAGPPSKTPPGTLTRMQNMQVMDEGTVATRPGCVVQETLANTLDGAFTANDHFYKLSTGYVYNNSIALGFYQEGRRLRTAALTTFGLPLDIVFFPMVMKKYYKGTVSNWGISQVPTTPIASDTGIAGNLTGNYIYKIGFYSSTTKTLGPLSDGTTSINVASKQVLLSALPTEALDAQVDKVRIFRTQGTITATWQVLADVDLGTYSYTDNISDNGLGDIVSNYLISPPRANVAGRYKSRILLLDVVDTPRYCYASEGSFPEQYRANLFEMVADAGDTIEEVVYLGDYSFVFGRKAIYQFQITNQGIIYTSKVLSGRGTLNGRTVAMGGAGIYFWSDDGIYAIQGFNAVKMSDTVDAVFRGVSRGGLSTIADTTHVAATAVGSRYYFTYLGADAIYHTLIYNELKQRWKHYTGWNWTCPPSSGSYPVVGLDDAIGLYTVSATSDCGSAFTSQCAFSLPTTMTSLMDIRTFRVGLQSTGTVNISFWEDGVPLYSIDLDAPTFGDSYVKHSLPPGVYFMQPEVVLTSDSPFTLKLFEADVHYVRKYEADYTRQVGGQPISNLGQQG